MMGSSTSKEQDEDASKNSDSRTQKKEGKARKSFPAQKKVTQRQEIHTSEVAAPVQQESPTHKNGDNAPDGIHPTTGLTRRRLRQISTSISEDDDIGITNIVASNLTPLLIPKRERTEPTASSRIPQDPRILTDNPTEPETIPILVNVKNEKETEPELSSAIEIDNVKKEIEDLSIENQDDWIQSFIDKETATPIEPVRIKTEPIDEDDINATSQHVEDDRCSVDSGSTVGLPSPQGSPSPSLTMSTEENEITHDPANRHCNGSTFASSSLSVIPSSRDNRMEGVNSCVQPAIQAATLYSEPTDLQEVYRSLEREQLASEAAKKPLAYSREIESSEESSDEELEQIMDAPTCDRFSDGDNDDDDIGDDDGELFDDDDREVVSSWVSPEISPVENVAGQKRPLSIEEPSNNDEGTPTKKSRFLVVKDPQISDSASLATVPEASTSTKSATDVDKNQPSTRPKAKVTIKNRASMLMEDVLTSVNTPAAQVPTRPVTPAKNIKIKVKKQHAKQKSTSFDTTSSAFADSDSGIPPAASENVPRQQQNPYGALANIRDPRFKNITGPPIGNQADAPTSASRPLDKMLYLSNRVKINILIRVLKWQFSWIAEQTKLSEPPPLLNKVKFEDNEELRELSCNPVCTEYPNRESYFKIFHPLMLHEMWANLYLQNQQEKIEKKNLDWDVLIKSSTEEGPFCLLQCSLLLELEENAPLVNDLIKFSFTRANGKLTFPFGFVELSHTTRVIRTVDLDPRLTSKIKAEFSVDVVIRILKNYAPTQLNIICSVSKIASLSTAMALFRAQGALAISPIRNIIFKPHSSAFELTKVAQMEINNLDTLQAETFFSITQTMTGSPDVPKIAMVQGFPGTGKTHVLVFIIGHLLGIRESNNRRKILYCAPTNAAVDEMIRRLLNYCRSRRREDQFSVLRIGSWNRLHKEVRDVTLDDIVKRSNGRIKQENKSSESLDFLEKKKRSYENEIDEFMKERDSNETSLSPERFQKLEKDIAKLKEDIEAVDKFIEDAKIVQEEKIANALQELKNNYINNADVICTTLEACHNSDLENIFLGGKPCRPFSCCVIDDASLVTEPQTLFPLALGMNKFILAGDVELKPFALVSSVARENKLDQSLFSRFNSYLSIEHHNDRKLIHSLDTQHRMNEEICRWASKYYYGHKFLSSSKCLKSCSPLHPYRVLDVKDSREITDGPNFINKAEAEVIVKIIGSIVRVPEMKSRVIGVITFFETQRRYIRYVLQDRLPKESPNIEVKLMQDLQGTEMDIVIISCAKTNIDPEKNLLSELTDYWNVAITRATESLYICGNLKTLQRNEVLHDLIRDAHNRQVIRRVSSFFEMSLLYDVLVKSEMKSPNSF